MCTYKECYEEALIKLYIKIEKLFFLIFMWIYFYKLSDNQRFGRTYCCKSGQNLYNLQKLIHTKVCPNKSNQVLVNHLQMAIHYILLSFLRMHTLRTVTETYSEKNLNLILRLKI